MSENDKVPGPPPPDDFSKTTPNINVGADQDVKYDWDKTNYNLPKQPAADDWGKTVTNIKPIDTSGQDFGKTIYPGSRGDVPGTPDWGVTNANVRVNAADVGSAPEDFGAAGGYDKTTPYFRLPEAERAKYQNLPPTPTEQAEQAKREQAAKGGIPGWVWAGAGLFSMFLFAVVVLLFVYFFIIRETYFEVTVRLAPPGSRILVDDQQWGLTSDDGSRKLNNLKPGKRVIKIVHPNFECKPMEVNGEAGVEPEPLTARCVPVQVKPGEDCGTFSPGEFDKAERCYNMALDNLPDPYSAEDLINALNILIINFESGKYDIPSDRLAALQKGAGFIKKLQDRDPTLVLEVGGHTDSTSTPAVNNPLSQNRANAVKDQLVKYGVNPAGLQTRGYGADKPKFDNNTEQGKFLNRRIQYSIVRSTK
jgi:outer membrane protein OmpA-like peptidoglycan-associated protein